MGANIVAFIQFDDNYPLIDQSPFTCEPSLWSLEWDYGLWGCKDYGFIGAISGIRNQSGKEPLIKLRGCPPGNESVLSRFQDEPFVGYLSYLEIIRCLEYHDLSIDRLHRSVQMVLAVLAILSNKYGDNRVRLVFEIQD